MNCRTSQPASFVGDDGPRFVQDPHTSALCASDGWRYGVTEKYASHSGEAGSGLPVTLSSAALTSLAVLNIANMALYMLSRHDLVLLSLTTGCTSPYFETPFAVRFIKPILAQRE